MRIAVVHPYPWPEVRRGAERYLDDLTRYLAAKGHEVTILTGTHGEASVERLDDGVVVQRVRHLQAGPLRRKGLGEVETFGVQAVGPLRRLRPDVVHAFTPSGALAGKAARRPTLYTVLGHPASEQLPTQSAPRWLLRAAVRTANRVAALSRSSARALVDTFGREGVVLPPGVSTERFPPNLDPRTGPPRLLFSATLADRRKRADLAVSTLARLLERHPDARLELSGEGDPSWALEAAGRHGSEVLDAVDVLGAGAPTDLPGRYRAASVTLLPAEHEAFGLALVESLACGTPVVCSPSGGMPEIVGHEEVGRTAATATLGSLADAIESALEMARDPSTPPRCVARARRWDWVEAVGPMHEQCYESLLAEKAPEAELVR